MPSLHWLKKPEREELDKVIEEVVITEISKRYWGEKARGCSPGGAKRILIADFRGLAMASGVIRYFLNQHNTDVLYRGQHTDWELFPSLYRNTTRKQDVRRKIIDLELALKSVKDIFDFAGTNDEREALAQHYGCNTRWLDVVDHLNTAAWFAFHQITIQPTYDTAVGYISLIAIPRDDNKYLKLIDLRNKPSTWLRPHVQQAFSIRAENCERNLGSLSEFCVATFVIPKSFLRQWSAYDSLPPDVMFPNSMEDRGFLYAKNAQERLNSMGITVWMAK